MTVNRASRRVQGEVIRIEGEPNPHSFWIRDREGTEYFAHLGDLRVNSGKLLRNENINTEFLRVGDQVEFMVWEDNIIRGFNVVRMNSAE